MPLFQASIASPGARAFVAIGLLGGFTTFSTFSFEAMALVQDGQWQRAATYTLGSIGLGLFAVFAGFWLGTMLLQGRT
jgi:CrcB protein